MLAPTSIPQLEEALRKANDAIEIVSGQRDAQVRQLSNQLASLTVEYRTLLAENAKLKTELEAARTAAPQVVGDADSAATISASKSATDTCSQSNPGLA